MDALLIEAQARQQETPIRPATVYWGGGTPSMLSDKSLARLFNGLREIFDWQDVTEVTFEANPATFNRKRAQFFKEIGITRMSLGVQSWDEGILRTLGREHTPAKAEESIQFLREAGIPEINVDLMFSIPGQSLETWEHTLRKTLEISPEHISAYNLNYEEDTAFFDLLKAGKWSIDEDKDASFFLRTHNILTSAGYRHYETSNFARDNHLSQHNLSYWKGEDYMGIGPGAVSTLNGVRLTNPADTNAYIRQLLESGTITPGKELLSNEDFIHERIALLLRTDIGLPLRYIPQEKHLFLQQLTQESLAVVKDNTLFLSDKGRLLVDEIAVEFY